MSKTLYEEALADVKQLKEVAESNAKRAIIETVTPKIRDLIEKQLLGEMSEEVDEIDGVTGALDVTHPNVGGSSDVPRSDVPPPGEKTEESQYEVTSESIETLLPFSAQAKPIMEDRAELKVYELAERTDELVSTSADKKVTEVFTNKINETIQEIEDMYSYLQESIDSSRKSKLENKLENCFEILNAVKESTMRMKDLVSESNLTEDQELTLKLTGLPDDVELDKLNIDLVSDEEGEEAVGAMPPTEPGGEEMLGSEPPLPSENYGLDELDEDEVVEISESMLKQEIARMKKFAESGVAPVTAHGEKMSDDVLSNFGGGEECGEPWLDGEVSTNDKDNMVKQGVVKEADELDEDDDMDDDDDDDMDEVAGDLKGKMDDDHLPEAKKALAAAGKALAEARNRSEAAAKKFNEAKATFVKHKGGKHEQKARNLAEKAHKSYVAAKAAVTEATDKVADAKKVLKEALENSATRQLAESKAAVESLRKQLVETNLLNAKLIHANKLLQSEGLTAKQKAVIIDKLDEAQNLREVKLVYESLVKALNGDRKPMKEGADRQVVAGSSSRPTKPSGAGTLNEGYETARWAKLAGLSK